MLIKQLTIWYFSLLTNLQLCISLLPLSQCCSFSFTHVRYSFYHPKVVNYATLCQYVLVHDLFIWRSIASGHRPSKLFIAHMVEYLPIYITEEHKQQKVVVKRLICSSQTKNKKVNILMFLFNLRYAPHLKQKQQFFLIFFSF